MKSFETSSIPEYKIAKNNPFKAVPSEIVPVGFPNERLEMSSETAHVFGQQTSEIGGFPEVALYTNGNGFHSETTIFTETDALSKEFYHTDPEMKYRVRGETPPGLREALSMEELMKAKAETGAGVIVKINTKNEQENIGRTLEDIIRAQGLVDRIVVTDVSDDNTPEIVEEYAQKYPGLVKLLRVREFMEELGVDFESGKGGNFAAISYLVEDPKQVVISIDADYHGNKAAHVQAMASPLITEGSVNGGNIAISRAILHRTTQMGSSDNPQSSGERVTNLNFKPVADHLFDNSASVNPLAGVYAFSPVAFSERLAQYAETNPMPAKYGIETLFNGIFNDEETAQVYCGRWNQVGQSTKALEKMAYQVTATAVKVARMTGKVSPEVQPLHTRTIRRVELAEDGVPEIIFEREKFDGNWLPTPAIVQADPKNQILLAEAREYILGSGDKPAWLQTRKLN